jgi:hypothetical protein
VAEDNFLVGSLESLFANMQEAEGLRPDLEQRAQQFKR